VLCAIQNFDILRECYTNRDVPSKGNRHLLILFVNNGFFCQAATKVGSNFDVLLTVRLSIILAIDQLKAQILV